MESALYGINARVFDVSETSLVCCVHSSISDTSTTDTSTTRA